MKSDPILEELWRIKDEIAAEHGYDLDSLFADLVRRQQESEARGVKYVTLPPRRVEAPPIDAAPSAG